jgi:hypothetical protein
MADTQMMDRTAKNATVGLSLFTAVMALVALYVGRELFNQEEGADQKSYWFVLLWSSANVVIAGLAALVQYMARPGDRPYEEQVTAVKLRLLTVGGLFGFTTLLLGLALAFLWWGTLTGGRAEWRTVWPYVPVGTVLGGLFAMFASLLLGRSEERTNPTLRRVLYGYNAALTGLLVLAALGVGDVLAYFYANKPFDWTATNIYSISPQTAQIVEQLDRPVAVYVLIPPTDPMYQDLETLLTTAKAYDKGRKLTVEYINPTRDRAALAELVNKYELLERVGVLVVYDPEGQNLSQFIRPNDLEDASARFRSDMQQRSFTGERAIMSAVSFLRQGKVNLTLYFTQDSGELKLGDGTPQLDRGTAALRSKLEKANYTVKELNLGAIDPATGQPAKVPDDAFAVVMAGPQDVTAARVKALEEYMNRPNGRLVVLLDVRRNREGQVQPTGLEAFLAKFGVQVGQDIILNPQPAGGDDPTEALVRVSPQSDRAILQAFPRSIGFQLLECRSVRPAQGSPYVVTPLLETVEGYGQWAEDNLRGSPIEYMNNLARTNRAELLKKISSPAVPVAVTVRERSSTPPDPNDPHAAFKPQDDGAARMVVFGDATMVSQPLIEGGRDIYYNIFASSLAWLRNRYDLITAIEPKERKAYRLTAAPEDLSTMRWGSILVLLGGVIALGAGVWFVRRR